jgi:hypothetical protein
MHAGEQLADVDRLLCRAGVSNGTQCKQLGYNGVVAVSLSYCTPLWSDDALAEVLKEAGGLVSGGVSGYKTSEAVIRAPSGALMPKAIARPMFALL